MLFFTLGNTSRTVPAVRTSVDSTTEVTDELVKARASETAAQDRLCIAQKQVQHIVDKAKEQKEVVLRLDVRTYIHIYLLFSNGVNKRKI